MPDRKANINNTSKVIQKDNYNQYQILHLHNSHTFQEASGILYQNQELIQGMDCIFLEVVIQRK